MDTQRTTVISSFVYNRMPPKVSRKDFNRYIDPHLQRPKTGPKPTLSLYNIFHDLLSVLHTGRQWAQRKTQRPALHDTNGYQWHHRWAKDGASPTLLHASLLQWHHTDPLDPSVRHGDGSNPVGKKGAAASALPVISTSKVPKHCRS